jgi:hypothetical protein
MNIAAYSQDKTKPSQFQENYSRQLTVVWKIYNLMTPCSRNLATRLIKRKEDVTNKELFKNQPLFQTEMFVFI